MLHHARKNPDSEVGRLLVRLLNRYVPKQRRSLFVEEFGIDPLPPEAPAANDRQAAGLKAEFSDHSGS